MNLSSFMSKPLSIEPLHGIPSVWRADALADSSGTVVATGSSVLDAQLPGGGWPMGAAIEILQAHAGRPPNHCEWRLLLPALTCLARTTCGALVLVGAPHMPFCPGLAGQGLDVRRLLCINTAASASRLWATEQALRCADVAAVLAWLPQVRSDQLRRLQMAAAVHTKLLFVMRPAQAQSESSPAALRLLVAIQANSDALELHILKRRGPPLAQPLLLPARPARLAALLAIQSGLTRQPRQEDQVGKIGEVVQLGQLSQLARLDPQEPRQTAAVHPMPAAIYTLPRPSHALDRIAAAA